MLNIQISYYNVFDMNFIEDREALTGFYPADPYNDGLIQLEALQQLGYEVEISWVSNDHPDLQAAAHRMAEKFSHESWDQEPYRFHKWGRAVIGHSVRPYVGMPDIPADSFHDDAPQDSRLWEHPARLVGMVHLRHLSTLLLECERLMGKIDLPSCFEHRNPNYPWLQTIGGCFMKVLDDVVLEDSSTLKRREYESAPQRHREAYRLLKAEGVRQINPEQLCGIMADFYRMAGEEVPAFAALRIGE